MGAKFTSILGRILGRGGTGSESGQSAAGSEYKGFMIRPAPRRQDSQWLTAGVISKEFEAGVKEQQFIRADVFANKDEAEAYALTKGKQIIDEQGDKLFKGD